MARPIRARGQGIESIALEPDSPSPDDPRRMSVGEQPRRPPLPLTIVPLSFEFPARPTHYPFYSPLLAPVPQRSPNPHWFGNS